MAPGGYYGFNDPDERVEGTMKSMMRLMEIRDSAKRDKLGSKRNMETQLSFLGIRYQKDGLEDFQKRVNEIFASLGDEEKEREIFKLSFALTMEFTRNMRPDITIPEYQEWVALRQLMYEVEHEIEPSEFVNDELKKLVRRNIIIWFLELYAEFESRDANREREKDDSFDNAILILAGDAMKPYEKIMAGRATTKKAQDEFELEDENDEYDDNNY